MGLCEMMIKLLVGAGFKGADKYQHDPLYNEFYKAGVTKSLYIVDQIIARKGLC